VTHLTSPSTLTGEAQAVLLAEEAGGAYGHLPAAAGGQARLLGGPMAGGAQGLAVGALDAPPNGASATRGEGASAVGLLDEVASLIESRPEDAVRVLRAWLQD
jgi:hypothetical protein